MSFIRFFYVAIINNTERHTRYSVVKKTSMFFTIYDEKFVCICGHLYAKLFVRACVV